MQGFVRIIGGNRRGIAISVPNPIFGGQFISLPPRAAQVTSVGEQRIRVPPRIQATTAHSIFSLSIYLCMLMVPQVQINVQNPACIFGGQSRVPRRAVMSLLALVFSLNVAHTVH